jgi:hypothetical protein
MAWGAYNSAKKTYYKRRGNDEYEDFDCTFEGCLLYDDAIIEEDNERHDRALCKSLDKCLEKFINKWEKTKSKRDVTYLRSEALRIKEQFMKQISYYESIAETIVIFKRRLQSIEGV